MRQENLPTWEQIAGHTIQELDAARNKLSEARDWLISDWRPGTGPTEDQAAAKRQIIAMIGEMKGEIDQAKNQLW